MSGLAREVKTAKRGDTALSLAISMSCRGEVIAALCRLNHKVASMFSSSGRLPLYTIESLTSIVAPKERINSSGKRITNYGRSG